jgi:endonuclease YncB( thermonuclease family)
MEQPPLGATFQASSHRVIDGDTVEMKFELIIPIRIDKLQCPNVRTQDGKDCKYHLMGLLSNLEDEKEIVVHVHDKKPLKLGDSHSFSRTVGRIWVDGKDVTELMDEYMADKNITPRSDKDN